MIAAEALREFEAAVDIGVPLLSSKLAGSSSEESETLQGELPASVSPRGAGSETDKDESSISPGEAKRGFAFARRNGRLRSRVNWNYVWLPFAACILLTVALGIYAYRIGRSRTQEVIRVVPSPNDTREGGLEQQISDAGRERETLKAQLGERDRVIADLRRHIEEQSASLNDMKAAQANLEQSLQTDEAEKQRVAVERAGFAQKFDAAQATLQKMQADLDSARQQRTEAQGRGL